MKRGFATAIVAGAKTAPNKIIGYYTLSTASILLNTCRRKWLARCRVLRIFLLVADRLAVASGIQGQHVGSPMVLDALRRSCANELAWALFLVDATNERPAVFYEKFLFQRFEDNAFHLWMYRKQAKTLCVKY